MSVRPIGQILFLWRYAKIKSFKRHNLMIPQLRENHQLDNEDPAFGPSSFMQWPPARVQNQEGLASQVGPTRLSSLSWTNPSSNKCKLCGRRYNISCLLSFLPAMETCERLCSVFSSTIFPLMPLLHMHSFGEDFRTFWREINPANMHDSEPSLLLQRKPGFLSLLLSILFSSLTAASPSQLKDVLGKEDVPDKRDIYFAAALSTTLTGFPRQPSIYSLAAYIFAQSQFVREEDFSDAPDFITTSFRVALGMGLHRDFPNSVFTIAEMETRRRLWFYICHLDVMSSCSSGLSPLFLDEKMANTEAICRYDYQAVGSAPSVNGEGIYKYDSKIEGRQLLILIDS
jgi:hypothetical protein